MIVKQVLFEDLDSNEIKELSLDQIDHERLLGIFSPMGNGFKFTSKEEVMKLLDYIVTHELEFELKHLIFQNKKNKFQLRFLFQEIPYKFQFNKKLEQFSDKHEAFLEIAKGFPELQQNLPNKALKEVYWKQCKDKEPLEYEGSVPISKIKGFDNGREYKSWFEAYKHIRSQKILTRFSENSLYFNNISKGKLDPIRMEKFVFKGEEIFIVGDDGTHRTAFCKFLNLVEKDFNFIEGVRIYDYT